MKATPNLLKFKRIQQRLKLPLYATVGLLETLWWVTGESAPMGDIGKHSDEDIAAGVGWEGDPKGLTHALVETGWLDRHKKHRLVVHDWSVHCNRWVRGALTRRGISTFADGTPVRAADRNAAASTDSSTVKTVDQSPFLSHPIPTTPRVVRDHLPVWAVKRMKKAEGAKRRGFVQPWLRVVEDLQGVLNPGTFDTWFKPTHYGGAVGRVHFLLVPSLTFYRHIKKHHLHLLAERFWTHFPEGHELKLVPKEGP